MMMEPGGVEASSGPSRSNSPLPPLVSVPLPVPPMLPTTRSYGPLPSTPSPPSTAVSHHTSHPHAHHGSQTGHTLPPPPQAPHGPRKPMPPRSRSPSLERVGTVKGPRDPPSRQGSRENPNAESKDLQVQEITKGVVKASLRQERAPLLPTQGYDSVDILSAPVVVVPSAKALGKRRAAEPPTPMQGEPYPSALLSLFLF